MKDLKEALQVLDVASSKALLTRADHVIVQKSVNLLNEANTGSEDIQSLEAINILDVASSKAVLSRSEHVLVQQAVDIIKNSINSKENG